MWGCGVNPARWTPSGEGSDFELPIELQALDRELASGGKLRDQVSILSGFDVRLDGRPNFPHTAGLMGTLTGSLPLEDYTVPAPTLDTIIAAEIGGSTRFRSLEMSCTGNPNQSYSYESQSVFNAPEISPIALYTRVFGPEFADPNAGPFTPDPRVMLRQSVLSAVKADRDRLLQRVGAHDRQRLDQYFTSVRQLEQQLDILLAGPADLESCARATAPGLESLGTEVGQSMSTNRLMASLLSFALACDQTRVFSMMFSDRISGLRQPGSSAQHHQLTHDEALDPAIGYQPEATEFVYAFDGSLGRLRGATRRSPRRRWNAARQLSRLRPLGRFVGQGSRHHRNPDDDCGDRRRRAKAGGPRSWRDVADHARRADDSASHGREHRELGQPLDGSDAAGRRNSGLSLADRATICDPTHSDVPLSLTL